MNEAKLREKNGEHPFGDTGQLILFVLFVILWVADSFFLRRTTFLSASVPLILRIAAAVIVWAAGVWFVKAGHVVVNEDERPQEVVSSGAFRYVRHPLYLGSLLLYLGFTIVTLSLLSWGMFVVIFLFYDTIARYEERLLLAKFGEPYREYSRVTGKWLPKRLRGGAAV